MSSKLNSIKITPKRSLQFYRNHSLYPHIANNHKGKLIRENRYTEIERENRILLEKIGSIMKKKPAFSNHSSVNLSRRDTLRRSYEKVVNRSKVSIRRSGDTFDDYKCISSEQNIFNIRKHSNFILNETKFINNKIFTVKITQENDQILILVNDLKDSYLLALSMSQAIDVMNGGQNWNMILNSLHMEGDKLVLYQNPY